MLTFKALSESKKKTKVKINPKMADVMEGGAPITMHPYSKGGKVKKSVKENHGEDCDCMKCESKRRKDDVNDGPDVQNEAKVDKGRSDYGKASIRNYRRSGPGHDDPGMFDPSGKRGKTIEKRREEHKARRGVKGAKVPAYKRESFQRFVECWKTHKKVGMKMKGGKLVNDCRPKNEEKSYYIDKEAEKRGREREARKAQNKAAAKERAAQKRRSERNALRRQGKYGAVGGYYVTKHMEAEETKYEVMSKKKYASTHKDFKGGTKKEPRVSVYDPEKKATVSRLVKFSEMACGGKPTPPNPKAKKQRVANVGLTSEAKLEDVMTTSTPVTKKKELMHKIKKEEVVIERLGGKGYKPYTSLTGKKVSGDWEDSDRGAGNKAKKRAGGKVEKKSPTYKAHVLNKEEEAYIKNNNENIYGSQKEVSNQSDQSSKNETSILSEKDTALDIVKKNIIAKYGKGAIMRKGSNQPKKVRGAKSTVGTGKYLKKAKEKAQLKSDAKEMGYGNDTKGYVETRARYGSKENMKKGKGLGT